ncbi:hypothetical protein QEH44_gp38 [Arthrobacter phage Shambre1]|uniref:Uncharacterized protein n=1 Tax=Arthrobacter phage Shambre1 TaxID=2927284 RepID=A0A977KNL3_9CAUD|nr:hypothetical protein QEH44_gp38 [Arthrobacter phage Shambre1]UXE04774.1 hypothetical protein SEA_SHAMBRE1_38 [Arthrobacter phage Shambre1]
MSALAVTVIVGIAVYNLWRRHVERTPSTPETRAADRDAINEQYKWQTIANNRL